MLLFPENIKELFARRKLVIATMHGKEQALAPLITEALGVEIVMPDVLNTDVFGTFTGEIERTLSPLDAAVMKCKTAMEQTGCDLAVANEGSFGPHPVIGFVSSDEELVVLMDAKYHLQIAARELSTDTNFNGKRCSSYNEVKIFADEVLFPSHGLILRKEKDSHSPIIKGITEWNVLEKEVDSFLQAYGEVFVETDMRAMYNPSRLKVIEKAASKLIIKIFSACPDCHAPGYDVVDYVSGLPCSNCGTPTRSTLAHIYKCSNCNFEEKKLFPYGKETEDPMYCDVCNP
ncbi:MAG: hypothetical protein K2X48_03415 [Chitinophagaceae bacterium]|nr:hypothetical protein [Chitinophagaceae bacterium]